VSGGVFIYNADMTKPIKPRKPKKPAQIRKIVDQIIFNDVSSVTIDDLLKKITKFTEKHNVSFKDTTLDFCSGYSSCMVEVGVESYIDSLSEGELQLRMDAYDRQMIDYEVSMSEYRKLLKKYNDAEYARNEKNREIEEQIDALRKKLV